jgi:hypothetical protein
VGLVARTTAVIVLMVLGIVCLTLSPVAIWGRNLVLNTDRYVETVQPIAKDPGVQQAIITQVNEQIDSHLDVQGLITQALPGRAGTLLGPPLNSAIDGLVNTIVTRFVQSSAFLTVWTTVNRAAHQEIVTLLTGERFKDVSVDSSGRVTLNLGPIIAAVKSRLVAAGLGVASNIPPISTTLQIAEVKGLTSAQKLVRLLNHVADWLPWIGLALVAGSVALAQHRRQALIRSMLGVAGGMVVLGIALIIGRAIYLNGVPPDVLPNSTAENLFNTVVRFLRDGIRLVLLVALLIALVAWWSGPSRGARALRRRVSSSVVTRSWADTGTGRLVTSHRLAVQVGIVALGLIVLVLWDNPSVPVIVTIAVIVVLLLLVTEGFRHRPGVAATT